MKTAEYTIEEMQTMLGQLSGMYDLARVVDPRECRILGFGGENGIMMQERCYGVWDSGQRCVNCSSAAACSSNCHREKQEFFDDKLFNIQSNPVRLKLKDGTVYDAVVELISISEDKNKIEEADANDRREENEGSRAAAFFSSHDSLTKVLNADAFYEYSREVISGRPDADWVMINGDIMGFHVVNDLFGVEKGNELLMKTADMLKGLIRSEDGLCGRLGGDNFAVLIPADTYRETDLHEIARSLAEYETGGVYTVRIHFGVYEIPDVSIPVHVMCSRANTALRTISADAREIVAYYDEKIMENDLFGHRVISRFDRMIEEGHFRMYLQPLVNGDGKPFGAEALVRCVRSSGDVVAPGAFIPTLEKAGLIHELDAYMWRLAAKQLNRWKGTDKEDLTISVNMSARDFFSMDVYKVLTGLVAEYGIESRKLRLEITETALIRETEKVNAILTKLREEGFYIEIDDFGTGYSSLSILKDVHADMLKIDMGFLKGTENKDRCKTIISSVISMAEGLGMDVLTEGVETEQQLKTLLGMGCHMFQGYYFSRPIPVDEFEKLYS